MRAFNVSIYFWYSSDLNNDTKVRFTMFEVKIGPLPNIEHLAVL